MRHAPRAVADPPRNDRAARQCADGAAGVHALRRPDLRAGLPRRRHQADRRGRRPELPQAALHRLLELRTGVPVRRAEVRRRGRPDDEVRYVLRPHQHRPASDVRHCVPLGRTGVLDDRGDHADAAGAGGQRLAVRRTAGAHQGVRAGAHRRNPRGRGGDSPQLAQAIAAAGRSVRCRGPEAH